MELCDSPSIRAMTVSSVGSNTSTVTGDAVVVLAAVDVLLLVGEREVGPPTVAEIVIVFAEAVFESPTLSVVGLGDVSLLPVVGLPVTPSVITLAEVLVSEEYLVEIVVSVGVFTTVVDPSSVFGLVVKSTSSAVLKLFVVEDITTLAVVGGILLGNALALVEGLVVGESPVGFLVSGTELIGVEASSEVSVDSAALVVVVSSVGGSGVLVDVV